MRETRDRTRWGVGLVDAMVAIVILSVGILPLLGFIRSGASGVRPRADEYLVTNLCLDLLQRLAAIPYFQDPLREALEGGEILDPAATRVVAQQVWHGWPGDFEDRLDRIGLSLEIRRDLDVLPDPPGFDPARASVAAGRVATPTIEVWRVKASWHAPSGQSKEREFFRVTPSL